MARKRGKTICSTIHSPGSEAFFYFDRLILMCDGNIVYQGTASASVAHFREMKFEVPRFVNPADFFMKELSIKYPKGPDDEKKLQNLNNFYRIAVERRITTENSLIKLAPPDMDSADAINFKAPAGEQVSQLFSRAWLNSKREPRLSYARAAQTILVAFFMMLVFWGLDDYTS